MTPPEQTPDQPEQGDWGASIFGCEKCRELASKLTEAEREREVHATAEAITFERLKMAEAELERMREALSALVKRVTPIIPATYAAGDKYDHLIAAWNRAQRALSEGSQMTDHPNTPERPDPEPSQGERWTIYVCPFEECPGRHEFDVEPTACHWHLHPKAVHPGEKAHMVPVEVVPASKLTEAEAEWDKWQGEALSRGSALRRAETHIRKAVETLKAEANSLDDLKVQEGYHRAAELLREAADRLE